MNIHPTAIISEKASLGQDIEVGPYTIIEADVKIGQRAKIYSHVHILSHTEIGNDNQIHMGAVLGHSPQIRQSPDIEGGLVIGERNIIREYVTMHRSSQPGKATLIGNDNYFMGFSHIAHDCKIGNSVTVCNGTLLAGHVTVQDQAFISGNVTVHQFCRIGRYAMVGGLARVAKDVPPYMLVKGDSIVWAINSVGLRRGNFSASLRREIKQAFKLLYRSRLNVHQAMEQLQKRENSTEVEHLIKFIQHSQRGICAEKSPNLWERIRLIAGMLKRQDLTAYQLFQDTKWAR